MNGLDLFSGIGGISLALSPWVRTVAYCESDRYAQSVLLSKMWRDELDRAPIWDDVRSLRGGHLPRIDIISGGFPCQDISVAGRGAGLDGERSGLFFQITRLINDLRPSFVFLENVPAITTRGGVRVISELTRLGYDCRWTILSAAEVGAPHLRRRWWLLAHPNSQSSGNEWQDMGRGDPVMGERKTLSVSDGKQKPMANASGERRREGGTWEKVRGWKTDLLIGNGEQCEPSWWATEPAVGRVADGIQHRVDRLRCLGNSVVPLQAREAFKRLAGITKTR